jgi:tetratricopeptide (TPR) repeat protein
MPYSPLQLAEAHLRMGELSDALAALDAYLAETRDDAALRLRAAVRLRLPGEAALRGALADLDALAEPNAGDWLQRSVVWQHLGDWNAAADAALNASAMQPEDERIAERTLLTLEMSGRQDEAAALLARMPRTWRWLQLSGDWAGRQGDWASAFARYAEALDHLQTVLDAGTNPLAASLRGTLAAARAGAALNLGEYAQAAEDYRLAAETFPRDLGLPLMQAVALGLAGEMTAATQLAQTLLAEAPHLRELLRHQITRWPVLESLL